MTQQTTVTGTAGPTTDEFRINPILTLEQLKIRYVQWVVARFAGNKKAAADALGVKRQTVHNILKKAEVQ